MCVGGGVGGWGGALNLFYERSTFAFNPDTDPPIQNCSVRDI